MSSKGNIPPEVLFSMNACNTVACASLCKQRSGMVGKATRCTKIRVKEGNPGTSNLQTVTRRFSDNSLRIKILRNSRIGGTCCPTLREGRIHCRPCCYTLEVGEGIDLCNKSYILISACVCALEVRLKLNSKYQRASKGGIVLSVARALTL